MSGKTYSKNLRPSLKPFLLSFKIWIPMMTLANSWLTQHPIFSNAKASKSHLLKLEMNSRKVVAKIAFVESKEGLIFFEITAWYLNRCDQKLLCYHFLIQFFISLWAINSFLSIFLSSSNRSSCCDRMI